MEHKAQSNRVKVAMAARGNSSLPLAKQQLVPAEVPLHIQLTLTLKMTTAEVVETSVTVNNNSPMQDYVHPDDQTQPTSEMTPESKPFTVL